MARLEPYMHYWAIAYYLILKFNSIYYHLYIHLAEIFLKASNLREFFQKKKCDLRSQSKNFRNHWIVIELEHLKEFFVIAEMLESRFVCSSIETPTRASLNWFFGSSFRKQITNIELRSFRRVVSVKKKTVGQHRTNVGGKCFSSSEGNVCSHDVRLLLPYAGGEQPSAVEFWCSIIVDWFPCVSTF